MDERNDSGLAWAGRALWRQAKGVDEVKKLTKTILVSSFALAAGGREVML